MRTELVFSSDEAMSDGSSRSKRKREGKDPNPTPSKQPHQSIPCKNLNQIPRPQPRQSMTELCSFWNRKAQIGLTSETAKRWLRKMT